MRYLSVSDAWINAYASNGPDIIGHNHYEKCFVPQILRATYRLAAHGQNTEPVETSYIRPDTNELEWLTSRAVPWYTDDDTIGGIVIINQIITDQKLAQGLNQRRSEIQEWHKSLETLGIVASGIAHEINSPAQYISDNLSFLHDSMLQLNELINTYRSALADEAIPGPILQKIARAEVSANLSYLRSETIRAVEQAQIGIHEISRIVQAIKTFSDIEKSNRIYVDINAVISDSILISKYHWKDIADFETDLDPKISRLMGYKDQLGQVVLILIMNAIHAIEDMKHLRRGKISITSQDFKDYLEIHVDDNGIGIPKENIEKIFTPYYTTKNRKRGTGQGLSTAKKIIAETHGGQIFCNSDIKNATRITVRLPYHKT